MPTTPFNPNPAPQGGNGAFGAVPGPIGLPDPFGDVNKAFGGNLGNANSLSSGDILAQLGGNITPATLNAFKLGSAQFGQGSGMGPLSGLATNQLFGNIAGFAENQAQKGIQNLNSSTANIAEHETVNPTLQSDIASRNATFGAAPNPAAAASYARQLYEEYLNRLRGGVSNGPGGGYSIVGSPGGGTINDPNSPQNVFNRAPYNPGVYSWSAGAGNGSVGTGAGGLPPSTWFDRVVGGNGFQPGDYESIFGPGPEDWSNYGTVGPTSPGETAPYNDNPYGDTGSQFQPGDYDYLFGGE